MIKHIERMVHKMWAGVPNTTAVAGFAVRSAIGVGILYAIQKMALSEDYPTHKAPLDHGILTEYIQAAMRHVKMRLSEDGNWYAAIPGIEAAWGHGESEVQALDDLRRSLEFVVLTSVFEHMPLPAYDSVSLRLLEEYKGASHEIYSEGATSEQNPLDALDDSGE